MNENSVLDDFNKVGNPKAPVNNPQPDFQNTGFDPNAFQNQFNQFTNPATKSSGLASLFQFTAKSGRNNYGELVTQVFEAFKNKICNTPYYKGLQIVRIEPPNKDISAIVFYTISDATLYYYPLLIEATKNEIAERSIQVNNEMLSVPTFTYQYIENYSDSIEDAIFEDLKQKQLVTAPANCVIILDPTGSARPTSPSNGNPGTFVISTVNVAPFATVLRKEVEITKHDELVSLYVEYAYQAIKSLWLINSNLPTFARGSFNDPQTNGFITIDHLISESMALNAKYRVEPYSRHQTLDGAIHFADFTATMQIAEKQLPNQQFMQPKVNIGSSSAITLTNCSGFIDFLPSAPSEVDINNYRQAVNYGKEPPASPGFMPVVVLTDIEVSDRVSFGTHILSAMMAFITAHLMVQEKRYLSVFEKSIGRHTKPNLGLLGLLYDPKDPLADFPRNPVEYIVVSGYDDVALAQQQTNQPVLTLIDFAKQFLQEGIIAVDFVRGGPLSWLLGIFANNANEGLIVKEMDAFTNGKFGIIWEALKASHGGGSINIGTAEINSGYFMLNGDVVDIRAIDYLTATKALITNNAKGEFNNFVTPLYPDNQDTMANLRRMHLLKDVIAPNCVLNDITTRIYINPLLMAAATIAFHDCNFAVGIEGLGTFDARQYQRMQMNNVGNLQYGNLVRPRQTAFNNQQAGSYFNNASWTPGSNRW